VRASGDDTEKCGGRRLDDIAVVADAASVEALDCEFMLPIDVFDSALLAAPADGTVGAVGGSSAFSHGN